MLKCFYILICITIFKLCYCQRRIGLGNESILGKKYLVYFVKSPYSKADDDAWLCAGALVTHTQILTAAACLVEMEKIYAIAGYKKYVHGRNINDDECTKTRKQKVVSIVVPKEYMVSAETQPEWMNVDIGVATVEKPYNFSDLSYRIHCSYEPQMILINFEKDNEIVKSRAMAFGWGEKKVKSANQQNEQSPTEEVKTKTLQEASTTVIEKRICANLATSDESKEIVNQYLLCASGNGFLVADGGDTKFDPNLEGCHIRRYDLTKADESICVDEDFDFRRKNLNATHEQDGSYVDSDSNGNSNSSRRTTLTETCQNDHGGPLTRWVGVQEMVIGVALNGISHQNFECVGPRLYVSTAETSNIIRCLMETNMTERTLCNEQIDDKRYEAYEINIKWPEDNQTSAFINSLKISSYLRQGNEEQPLHVRPTKDLGPYIEEPSKQLPLARPKNRVYEPQMNQKRAQPYYPGEVPPNQAPNPMQQPPYEAVYDNPYEQPREDPALHKPPHQDDPYRQPGVMDLYNQPPPVETYNQPQMESYNPPPATDSFVQPPVESYQPPMEPYNPPPPETYNQPQIDSYNQPQLGLYNQPPMDMHNQPPLETYNQPQIDARNQQPPGQMYNNNNNQQLAYKPPQADIYSQPQLEAFKAPSFSQPQQMETYKPPPVDSYNQPQMDSFKTSAPPADSYNQPQREPYKPPTVELYKPPKESFKPLPVELYKPPQVELYKPPQGDPYNHGQADPFKQPPVNSFNPPQPIPEMGSFKPTQANLQPYNPPQADPYKPPQAQSYNHPQSDSFKIPAAESYNPLDILSQNQPETESFKLPIVEPYKPSVEPYKKTGFDSFLSQPYKPAPVEPYEQPHLRQIEQSHSQQRLQPIEPPRAPAPQPFDPSQVQNILRERPHNPAIDPPRSETQSFEQMYSQLNSPGSIDSQPSPPPPPAAEETFEELYKNLHDPTLEIPHEQDFDLREQPPDQRFDPRFDQQFEQQFDVRNPKLANEPETFDRNPKKMNEQERFEAAMNEKQEEVKVRPQVPLDYPDYFSYSRRSDNK